MGSLCSSVGTLCSTVEFIHGLVFNIKKLRDIKWMRHYEPEKGKEKSVLFNVEIKNPMTTAALRETNGDDKAFARIAPPRGYASWSGNLYCFSSRKRGIPHAVFS